MSVEFLGTKPVLFYGIVEDINDPLKIGRVRVRAFTWHTTDSAILPTEDLPWAQPIQQVTSAARDQVGFSPTGLAVGSWVMGVFIDGEDAQRPFILGSIAGYPKESDVSRLARNDANQQSALLQDKEDERTTGVAIANSTETWDEPASTYAAQYPNNHVMQTAAGHVKEFDDTENATRIHEYHTAGTFYEIDDDGNKVVRIIGDKYEIVAGANHVNIKGVCNITIDSDCKTYIKGDWDIQVDKNINMTVNGNVTETIAGDQTTQVSGDIDIDGSRIDLN